RFAGNGVAKQSLATLPPDPKWDELRKLTGTFLVAPAFDVTFQGNFGTVAGTVVADRVTITGNTEGSVVTLTNNPLMISGSSAIGLSAPSDSKHSGLRFKERYVPDKA